MNSVDVVAYLIGGIIANIIERKMITLICLLIAIIAFGISSFLNLSDLDANIMAFLARFTVSLISNILYTYTFELYPTVIRSYGFGYCNIFGGIGSFVVPSVIEYFQDFVTHIFMAFNIFNFILVLFLPETLDKNLPDFIAELVIQPKINDKNVSVVENSDSSLGSLTKDAGIKDYSES